MWAELCTSNEQPTYLVVSVVVVVSVPLRALPQGGEDEASEVGGAGCSQSHWMGANVSVSESINTEVIVLF